MLCQLLGAVFGTFLEASLHLERLTLVGKYALNKYGINGTNATITNVSFKILSITHGSVDARFLCICIDFFQIRQRQQYFKANGCFIPYCYRSDVTGYQHNRAVFVNTKVWGQVFGAEFFGTLLLLTAVFQGFLAKPGLGRNWGPVVVGLAVFVIIESMGPISGAAINPCRFFGEMPLAVL